MKHILLLFALIGMQLNAQNQPEVDSAAVTIQNFRIGYKQLIVPSVLIGYGIIGLESDQLKDFNAGIREEVVEDIDRKFTIDDVSQFAPAATVYALNAAGIEGLHGFRDRTVILATSYLIVAGTTVATKSISNVERPDGTSRNSFPSGHTATAFAGAEFLWQEYKDQSVWYGVAGYAVAAGTGVFRILNNRHWLTDVAAGAGIGILSTKVAYWVNPYLTTKIFGSHENRTALLVPFYNGREAGLCYYWQR